MYAFVRRWLRYWCVIEESGDDVSGDRAGGSALACMTVGGRLLRARARAGLLS